MSDYRDDARDIIKDAKWTLWKVLRAFLGFFLVVGIIGFGTRSCGLWGKTVVERKVFEGSYQRSEAFKSRVATYEAQLVEVNAQLDNPNLSKNVKFNLEAQQRALRAQIRAAEAQQ